MSAVTNVLPGELECADHHGFPAWHSYTELERRETPFPKKHFSRVHRLPPWRVRGSSKHWYAREFSWRPQSRSTADCAFELVVATFNRHGDLFLQALEVLFGFGKLRRMLAYVSPAFPEIPKGVIHVYPDRPEVADEEGHTILVAVARKCRDVGNVRRLRGCHASPCLRDRLLRRADLRVFVPGHFHVLGFCQSLEVCRDLGFQLQFCVQRKSQQIVQLHYVVL